jgi:GNAT superfamily N-acetyltransferase
VQIRDATPADRDLVIAFDHLAGSGPARIQFIDRVLRSATCLVAERQDRVIAYAALEYTFYDDGFVSMVYVAEPERHRGVGRTLMEALAARCKTPELFTSTNESNEPMRELLTLLGYVPSGVIHNLDPGDPELVYFLDLGERAAEQAAEAARPPRASNFRVTLWPRNPAAPATRSSRSAA